ncbi:MAG: hypothetical protein R3F18_18670 [Lysobacterales bacterium]
MDQASWVTARSPYRQGSPGRRSAPGAHGAGRPGCAALTRATHYTGFDELRTLTSPDTGVTGYTQDAAGNLDTRINAHGVVSDYDGRTLASPTKGSR